jgi:hypothetical protein
MQPDARQSITTVMVTSTTEQNPGGILQIPDFLTIDFSCIPDGYCSMVINEEYLISGTHQLFNREIQRSREPDLLPKRGAAPTIRSTSYAESRQKPGPEKHCRYFLPISSGNC